ncbi:MAG: hypothetical protein ACPGU4_03585 [Flavobacteriales bacterium]
MMFASEANGSLKYNRGQRLVKRSFQEISASYNESDRVIVDKKLSPAQFERFKIKLKEKRRRELFLTVLTLFIIGCTVVSILVFIVT